MDIIINSATIVKSSPAPQKIFSAAGRATVQYYSTLMMTDSPVQMSFPSATLTVPPETSSS